MKLCRTLQYAFALQFIAVTGEAAAQHVCNSSEASTMPTSRYIVNNDGTVFDTRTKLMWKRCSEGLSGSTCTSGMLSSTPWTNAILIAKDSTFAGYNNWRLPNIKELASVADTSCEKPATNITIFPNTPQSLYWSSTQSTAQVSQSWQIDFRDAEDTFNLRSSNAAIRLVRDVE